MLTALPDSRSVCWIGPRCVVQLAPPVQIGQIDRIRRTLDFASERESQGRADKTRCCILEALG